MQPKKIANQIFNREDKHAEFWREYFKACQGGTNTRIMNARAEQLLRRQDMAVRRFNKAMKK